MTSIKESDTSTPAQAQATQSKGRLRVGVIAAASLLVGGLAAAWWYRKTLKTLRLTAENGQNPHFGITKKDTPDES